METSGEIFIHAFFGKRALSQISLDENVPKV
jgi:hypothetical protein